MFLSRTPFARNLFEIVAFLQQQEGILFKEFENALFAAQAHASTMMVQVNPSLAPPSKSHHLAFEK